MARVSKVDTCMFCDCTPCECNAKPAKAPKPKKVAEPQQPKPQVKVETPAPEPVKRSSFLEAMKSQAASAPQGIKLAGHMPKVEKTFAPKPEVETSRITVEEKPIAELLEEEALRNLAEAGMLDDEDVARFRMILTSKPTKADEVRIWKAQRNAVQAEGI